MTNTSIIQQPTDTGDEDAGLLPALPVTLNNQSKSLKITDVFITGSALLLYDLTVDGVIQ